MDAEERSRIEFCIRRIINYDDGVFSRSKNLETVLLKLHAINFHTKIVYRLNIHISTPKVIKIKYEKSRVMYRYIGKVYTKRLSCGSCQAIFFFHHVILKFILILKRKKLKLLFERINPQEKFRIGTIPLLTYLRK